MTDRRGHTGRASHHSGIAAEDRIARAFLDRGYEILARRWRGTGGELDLVLRQGEVLTFVEVKQARDLAAAAARLSPAQTRRILGAAEEFLATQPKGSLTECRFALALVDRSGAYEILDEIFPFEG